MTNIRRKVQESQEITEFQRKVYLALLDVPRGETITYGELAKRIGCRSAQAIGQALKRNPFAPEVPCHRVVAKDGIGGFFGHRDGEMIEKKIRLLKEEGPPPTHQQSSNSPLSPRFEGQKPKEGRKNVGINKTCVK